MPSMLSKKVESKSLVVEDWSLIPYQKAFDRQKQYVEEIIQGSRKQTLVFCHHPAVVTLGRGTEEGDVFSWTGETIAVNRGGRATYHGPSQLVFYPIVSLEDSKDLHGYMRKLEDSLIEVLKSYGIDAQGQEDATGVWVGRQKIASIGIAVKKWIASHGMAVNLYRDARAFTGINPCGFKTETMVSLEQLTDQPTDRLDFQNKLLEQFLIQVN